MALILDFFVAVAVGFEPKRFDPLRSASVGFPRKSAVSAFQ